MKKLVLLFALLVMIQEAFASGRTVANSWRWSIDEGTIISKAPASWLKPINVAPVISMPGAYRLRILTFTQGSYTFTANDRLILEYREEPQPNSNETKLSEGIYVHNNSATAGAWTQVLAENPATSPNAFAVDPNYDDAATGALKDREADNTTAGNLLYNVQAVTGNTPTMTSRHEDLAAGNQVRRGGVGLSKNSTIGTGDGSISGITEGGFETEYRLVVTQNAKPGTTYYFRQRNLNTAGNGAGTVDSWDYAGGFPSIAISNNYMGAVDANLPNIAVTMAALPNSMAFTSGETKSGNLVIRNLSTTVASTSTFVGSFTLPNNWILSAGTLPANWTLTGNNLTGAAPIAAGTAVTIPFTITAPATSGGGVFSFALGNGLGSAGGDGTVFNNRASFGINKP